MCIWGWEEREGGRENKDMEEGEREMLDFLQVLNQGLLEYLISTTHSNSHSVSLYHVSILEFPCPPVRKWTDCFFPLNLQSYNHPFIDYLTVSNQSSLFLLCVLYVLDPGTDCDPSPFTRMEEKQLQLLTLGFRYGSSLFTLACLGDFIHWFPWLILVSHKYSRYHNQKINRLPILRELLV